MDANWHKDYEDARNEMALAEEEYRLADSALAAASHRQRQAQRRCAELFRQRINGVLKCLL
jgi:hypothetical protein